MERARIVYEGDWTGVESGKYRWRQTDEGILVRGEKGVRRTKWVGPKNAPVKFTELAAHVIATYREQLHSAAEATGIHFPVLVAVVCCESAGDPEAERYEKRHKDSSIGLTQTLTATAHQIALGQGFPRETAEEASSYKLPRRALPHGGDMGEWRTFLRNPRNSILIGAGVLKYQDDRFKLGADPVLMYACYNAGSPRPSSRSGWGLVNYASALSSFVNFYGDAREAILPSPAS